MKERINITLSPALAKKVRSMAKEEDRAVSYIIAKLIEKAND